MFIAIQGTALTAHTIPGNVLHGLVGRIGPPNYPAKDNRMRSLCRVTAGLFLSGFSSLSLGAPLAQLTAYEAPPAWLTPIAPLRISDNVWQIGTASLTSLLVKTPDGLVLIDGGMPQQSTLTLDNIRRLGMNPSDVRYIFHSHAHIDHAGPLAAIREATGATLVSNAESAALLQRGGAGDLHFGDRMNYRPAHADRLVQDGETIELGAMVFTVHFTPGHTPGSMSWTWSDTRDGKPLRMAYVDSLSAPGYKLAQNPRYPKLVEAFRSSFARVRALPCDLLLTPHAEGSGWDYGHAAAPHPKPMSCVDYADDAERKLEQNLAKQSATS